MDQGYLKIVLVLGIRWIGIREKLEKTLYLEEKTMVSCLQTNPLKPVAGVVCLTLVVRYCTLQPAWIFVGGFNFVVWGWREHGGTTT